MTSAGKKDIPNNLIKAEELNADSFNFSDIKVKDGRVYVYVHNARSTDDKNKDFNVLTAPMKGTYGFSEFQGSCSMTVKAQSITDSDQAGAEQFLDFCKCLQERAKEYFIQNAKSILSPKDAKKLEKNPKLVQAFMNPIVKKDKNGEEEIKFKVKTDKDRKLMNLTTLTVEKYKIENKKKKSIEKNKIDLMKCENQIDVLKENIKPGSHVQCVVKPSVYWYGNKFGISFSIEALMVLKSSSTTVDNEAIDLDPETIGFSPPKKNKDGIGYSSLVLNKKTNSLNGKIKTGALRLTYGVSGYENTPGGPLDQSIVLMNQTDMSEHNEANEKLFLFSEGLNEAALDFAVEHKDILFKTNDEEELTRDLIESGYFNPCVSQNKNGDDQIKLKIIKDEEGYPTFKCFEYINLEEDDTKTEIDWKSMDDPESDIKNVIKGGSHIKAIIQPRIYFISNKIGINYRLIELHVQKSNYSKQNFNNVFAFSDAEEIKQSDTNDSEVTIEEESEVEVEEEEEVDSDAFGSDDDDDEEDEIVEASA